MGGYKSGGDFGNLSGGPGWRLVRNDFRKVEPGEVIYLPKGGSLQYFAKHQPPGEFRVRVTYKSMNDGGGFKLKDVWIGQVESPVVAFSYK
jgi:hypothetical protein